MSEVKKNYRPMFDMEELLYPQAKVDLMLEMDIVSGHADVRQSVILGLPSDKVILAQTTPPLGKSVFGRNLEASVIYREPGTKETIRWAWLATVLDLLNDYKLNSGNSQDPEKTVPVIVISRPDGTKLVKSNVRQAYRLRTFNSGITVDLRPDVGPVTIMNFSAGGMMLSTLYAPAFSLDQEFSFRINFPAYDGLPARHIDGRASVVRLEIESRARRKASLGLKFQELSPNSQLVLPKILHFYMLEEQRNRALQIR
jgi:hypothetical protein